MLRMEKYVLGYLLKYIVMMFLIFVCWVNNLVIWFLFLLSFLYVYFWLIGMFLLNDFINCKVLVFGVLRFWCLMNWCKNFIFVGSLGFFGGRIEKRLGVFKKSFVLRWFGLNVKWYIVVLNWWRSSLFCLLGSILVKNVIWYLSWFFVKGLIFIEMG